MATTRRNEAPQLPLMPKATAVWLVENTALTFDQIAVFCGLHPLEVKGIADGEVATGIAGLDPVANGQLTREEIERCSQDENARLRLSASPVPVVPTRGKGARYTPVSKRQDRPDAIAWILKFHPEIPDSQILKLLGTTKATVDAVRSRSHWNSPNIKPRDPVSLGICSQIELDQAVARAAQRKQALDAKREKQPGPRAVDDGAAKSDPVPSEPADPPENSED